MTTSRRSLLQQALYAAPFLSPTVLFSQSETASKADHQNAAPTTESFVVRGDESRLGPPWTIQGTPRLWDKIASADVGGRLSVIEVETPAGAGPPLHIHSAQNEWMFLLKGSFGVQCGSERHVLKAGDSFMAPMQVPHAYVVLGTETARHLNIYDPAGQIEAFFANYDKEHGPGGRPNPNAANGQDFYKIRAVGPPLKASSFSA